MSQGLTTKKILVASYGGSGSTFLRNTIAGHTGKGTEVLHSHAAPTTFLGIPVFNRFTGQGEGPLSREIELSRESKIIYIFRDPAQAIASRGSYKHFMHLWSETEYATRVFGHATPSEEAFMSAWNRAKRESRDIFGLFDHFSLWKNYASLGKHDIAFVKYEALGEHWESLVDWLDLNRDVRLLGFVPKKRLVTDGEKERCQELATALDQEASLAIYGKSAAPAERDISVPPSQGAVANRSFRVIAPHAGAADAFERIGIAYEVIASSFADQVELERYQNYHSPETDFFSLFSVGELPRVSVVSSKGLSSDAVEKLTASELIFWLLFQPSFFNRGKAFEVTALTYRSDPAVRHFRRWFRLTESFSGAIQYRPSSDPFEGARGLRVVAHLRRGDVAANRRKPLTKMMLGIIRGRKSSRLWGSRKRPLLNLKAVVEELETLLPAGAACSIIVASDGHAVRLHRRRFGRGIVLPARKLDRQLLEAPQSEKLIVDFLGAYVGNSKQATVRTLDAFHSADLIFTMSSSFPRLVTSSHQWTGTVIRLKT